MGANSVKDFLRVRREKKYFMCHQIKLISEVSDMLSDNLSELEWWQKLVKIQGVKAIKGWTKLLVTDVSSYQTKYSYFNIWLVRYFKFTGLFNS